MTEAPARSVAIRAEHVVIGLYVRALDRPWVDTPFVFQGFRVTRQRDVDTLRDYCRYVYVDLGRSAASAVERVLVGGLLGDGAEEGAEPGTASAATQVAGFESSPLFAGPAVPDRETFAPRVRQAAKWRVRLYAAMTRALRAVGADRAVDAARTRRVVAHMAEVIREDPTASLWLTRIRARQDYTSTHAVNTCVLALAFGHYLGLDGRDLEELGLGALLMDIGRVKVPAHIWPKPRALSATEWAFVRRHVDESARALDRSGVPAGALDVLRMHHERMRGQGYPRGVVGERIPWTALIAGLVDSYDAMVRHRPYRAAYTPDAAIRALYDDAGSTFGTDLVESFIRYLGTYPVGTVVELDNQVTGVVVGNRPGSGLWPTVLLVRGADGQVFQKRRLLNLAAAQHETGPVPARNVRRSLSPEAARVPVGRLVAREFGLERAPAGA